MKQLHLAKMGKGSLCHSIVTANEQIAKQYVLGAGTHHGRILVLNRGLCKGKYRSWFAVANVGSWGPGRAGGGEEMGGLRGVKHYMQRVAIQGSPTISRQSQMFTSRMQKEIQRAIHPFKKYFEELNIGDQIITEKRIITSEDIDKFADLSGDHFYAHLKTTDFTVRCLNNRWRMDILL